MRTLLALTLVSLALAGCGSSNCELVCERTFECARSDLDVDACAEDCDRASERAQDHEDRVQVCADCIDDRTCAESGRFCGQECQNIEGPFDD